MKLVELHVYPLKGARGIALERADVRRGGLQHDRRFLLIDPEGAFVTQRGQPTLALVTTAIDGPTLTLGTPLGGSVSLPLGPDGPRRMVRIWHDEVEAVEVGGAAAELVSEHLGLRCSLVYMPDDVVRPVESPYGAPGDRVGFADAYPVLLAARASLEDLNARLAAPIAMSRFRPNLVVDGGAPFDEERYERARVGSVTFRMPKRCSRCQVTTVDQDTAEVGKEPLRTLAQYRAVANNVYFAQNMIPDAEGSLAVGDDVAYLSPLT